jgi:hypothetical protein
MNSHISFSIFPELEIKINHGYLHRKNRPHLILQENTAGSVDPMISTYVHVLKVRQDSVSYVSAKILSKPPLHNPEFWRTKSEYT